MTPTAEQAFCLSEDRLESWGDFAARVAAWEERLPGAAIICNQHGDRLTFMAALAAAMLGGQTTLLPGLTPVEKALAGLDAPEAVFHLDAGVDAGGAPDPASDDAVAELHERLRRAEGEIFVFTSGSTGEPVRHVKRWRSLAGGAFLTEALIQASEVGPKTLIVGTTPHSHMYGLEATVFTPLAFGRCVYRGSVFYPADLERVAAAALEHGFESIVLVSCPAHLKYLEATVLATPQVAGVISAAAPLAPALAQRLEERGGLVVSEIYGSTETGSLAVRRTARDEAWRPLAGFELAEDGGRWIATAAHLDQPTPLNDIVRRFEDGSFRLEGRLGDLVQVAGKRTSLGALNLALAEAPGVSDGVVLNCGEDGDDQLVIFAVKDAEQGLPDAEHRGVIRRHMLRLVDPVFVPQQIRFVAEIPRNASGKITAAALRGLL